MLDQRLSASGDRAVRATHQSTFEVTTDDWLTPAGDCIVGIDADRAPGSFPDRFITACQDPTSTIEITLECGDLIERIRGRGDPGLTFENDRSMVARTSTYVDDRTVMVEADKAAVDLDRRLIERLQEGRSLEVQLSVRPGE